MVGEPFAFDFFQAFFRALAITDFSMVPAMVELGKVKRQVLFADAVERSHHAPL